MKLIAEESTTGDVVINHLNMIHVVRVGDGGGGGGGVSDYYSAQNAALTTRGSLQSEMWCLRPYAEGYYNLTLSRNRL